MKKRSIAFVFFGQNRIEDFIESQLKNINEAKDFFKEDLDFHIIDSTRDKINCQSLERVELTKVGDTNMQEEFDPLAEFRSITKTTILSGGMKKVTSYIPILDFMEFTTLRNDIDFIFRLRTDIFIDSKLIIEAIHKVLPESNKLPYTILKHKVWAQFFHLVIPFYIQDTSFLIATEDLSLISKAAINMCDFYPTYACPSCFWGPIFYEKFPYLLELASKFYTETKKTNFRF